MQAAARDSALAKGSSHDGWCWAARLVAAELKGGGGSGLLCWHDIVMRVVNRSWAVGSGVRVYAASSVTSSRLLSNTKSLLRLIETSCVCESMEMLLQSIAPEDTTNETSASCRRSWSSATAA